jgi:small subunit ribosomal protein S20
VAHSLSAKKRVRQNTKRRAINRARRSQMKTQVKHLETALTGGDVEKAGVEFQATVKKLDKMASKGILHKKTAARKKSRLAKQLNALKAKKSS